jgi:endonuclease-3 related protein
MPASHPDTAARPTPEALPEQAALRRILAALDERYRTEMWHWDPQHVRSPMDIIAGAVLVQHTTWTNAERALEQLRAAAILDPAALTRASDEDLLPLVRVSGTPTIKARRLRAVATTIEEAGSLDAFLALPKDELRRRLLSTHGIGPETADGILLYAAGHRIFLIDAYTQRLFRRIGLAPGDGGYDAWQHWFEDRLPHDDVTGFQRHHAHIVLHGKTLCRPKPRCAGCPLLETCSFGRTREAATPSLATP